ncbi:MULTISPECIES: helix-turn-helix domain-containing protein [unclassified Candidatus Frackibacter]|uniref:helix-turn-helix domain-containing protein n=1 Tax=unclassified Candidatus Frackibacter TaxID=2648818 RepID=UPI00088CAE87|nr:MULTISPECIES: helix-turn-helix transcriptional regulator [unclassified Candidatus Frackibacter]SDC31710.1 Helix-turn-helix [Candidatus Frackibacter sp. WG11]SEM73156.1 Helix-turn-helix [Candidatus Frackibacter sp. WG12]SFL59538.1 Helix-turn-helix [Candidatus Frackibacter sp. WG13]
MEKSIGQVIKEERRSKNIKQVDLAKKAGISNTYLSDIENERTEPSIKTIRNIARALNIDWTQIFLLINYVNSEQEYSKETKK